MVIPADQYPAHMRGLSFSEQDLEIIRQIGKSAAALVIENSLDSPNNSDGLPWKKEFSKPEINGLTVYSSSAKDTKIRRFKAVCEMDYSPADLWAFVSRDDHRKTWDRNIHDLTTCTVCEDDGKKARYTIMRCATKAVGPIAGRDFLDANLIEMREDGSICSCGSEIVNEMLPPSSNFTRGRNYPSGWYFTPLDDGKRTRVTYIIHTDLKGWFLPVVINNAIAATYIDFFKDLAKALKQGT